MAIEMRELKGDDTFAMMKILGKLNIKDEIVSIFNGDQDVSEREMGVKIMAGLLQSVFSNIGNAKDDLNALLSSLTGLSNKELGDLSFAEYTGLITDFFKKPELADFFKSIASLLK